MSALENIVGVQEPVKATIWYALNNYFYEDAIFLAERLHAEVGSLDSAYLLATSYYRSGRVQQAKHLLSRAREHTTTASSCSAQCNLLYARCCLHLKEYTSGLLALKSLQCAHDRFSESELAAQYGSDTGLALWLVGELNSQLNQSREAAKFFRAALKYNPFLWTAYQSLCEMGEIVDPKECFQVSDYPSFLQPSSFGSAPFMTAQPPLLSHDSTMLTSEPPQPTLTTSANGVTITGDTEVDLTCTEQSDMDTAPSLVGGASSLMGGVSSAFVPVESKGVITPSLYGDPAVGQAMASSTPAAARSLIFSTANRPPAANGQAPQQEDKGLTWSVPALRDIRAALFLSGGSSTQSSQPSGHVTGPRGHMTEKPSTHAVTPLAPSFGVLTFDTPAEPGSSTHLLRSPNKLLDFSRLTPSPSSSPMATNKLPFTPAQVSHPLMVSASIDRAQAVPGSSTNQNSEGMSHEEAATPPGAVVTPSLFKVPQAPKSEAPLRRSTRLKNTTRAKLSEHMIHSTRTVGKSRLKSPTSSRKSIGEVSKKGQKVSFTTPVNTHGGHPEGKSKVTPSISTSSLPPSIISSQSGPSSEAAVPCVGDSGYKLEDGVKEQLLSVGKSPGDSSGGSETREPHSSNHLQLLLEKQLNQQKQAAMTGLVSLMSLLGQIGSAYQSLCTYDLGLAVQLFQSLPAHQQETAWVKGQIARAYFAGERFKKCAQIYGEVHRMEPHRQEGMDLYSSSLWHLQKDIELSVLAESLHSSNKLSPQALCAMASVMNLNRNHESARKFLTRAIQVAPRFCYAHTLLGHEYWITKDYDKAISSFQDAVNINPRHYNAWYGMAHVHYAQEKYRLAETYAGRALSVNKCSSIACTQLALAQFRQGENRKALFTLGHAISINPSNPIPKFHRAKVLEAFGKPEEALTQLKSLTTHWPKEPELYISKGKILKSLGRGDEAVLQFSWALDFSRNAPSSHIREQIDQVYHEHSATHRLDHLDDSDFVPYPDPEGAELDDSERSVEHEGEGGSEDEESMNI